MLTGFGASLELDSTAELVGALDEELAKFADSAELIAVAELAGTSPADDVAVAELETSVAKLVKASLELVGTAASFAADEELATGKSPTTDEELKFAAESSTLEESAD